MRAWERIRTVCALPTDQKIVESGIFFKKGLTKSDSCGILYESDKNGVWHSLVVRLVRDQEAAGSSPVTPTIFVVRKGYNLKKLRFSGLFLYFQGLLRLLRRHSIDGRFFRAKWSHTGEMLPYIEESVFSAGTRIFLFLCYGGTKWKKCL